VDDELFLQFYLTNGFNGAAAWREVHPDSKALGAAGVNACRKLMTASVRARLLELLDDAFWKARQVSAEEVLARVGMDATANARLLVNEETGAPLGLHELSDEILNSVEAVEFEGDKLKKVKLASKTIARRAILEIAGKVKGAGGGMDELAAAMRETLARNGVAE
jgi:hypothetical protein